MNHTPTLQRLAARGRALAQRLVPQSASSRNVLKLAGGTAGSQLIAVAAAPILTRLYGPQSFGVLATFTSILALLNVVSSLRYELAIAVPEDDDEAVALVWLCFVLVAISTGLTALGVLLLGDQLVIWLNAPALNPLLWLLPVGVLLSGVYQPLSYWAIRHKQFGLLAQTKFRQSIFCVITNLAAAPLGTIGLLLGQIVSQSAGFVSILRKSLALLQRPAVTPAVLGRTLQRYSHFGIYSSPAGLINMAGSELPIIILASSFGTQPVGQLALAQRVLLLPAGLIGASVAQVFLSKAAEHHRRGSLPSLVSDASRKLLLWAISTAIPFAIAGPLLMPIVFGGEWLLSGKIIVLLIPLYIGQVSISSISMAFVVGEQNRLELLAQTIQALSRTLPLLASVLMGLGFLQSLLAFSCGSLVGYIFYLALLKKSVTCSIY
jgi:O-antigen/teichoic acid export membrane protein